MEPATTMHGYYNFAVRQPEHEERQGGFQNEAESRSDLSMLTVHLSRLIKIIKVFTNLLDCQRYGTQGKYTLHSWPNGLNLRLLCLELIIISSLASCVRQIVNLIWARLRILARSILRTDNMSVQIYRSSRCHLCFHQIPCRYCKLSDARKRPPNV